MTPPRPVLEAPTYTAANAIAPEIIGKKISQQAGALRHTIALVETLAAEDRRVIEVHPEVSFARWSAMSSGTRRAPGTASDLGCAPSRAKASSWPTIWEKAATLRWPTCSMWPRRRGARGATRGTRNVRFRRARLAGSTRSSGTESGRRPGPEGATLTTPPEALPCRARSRAPTVSEARRSHLEGDALLAHCDSAVGPLYVARARSPLAGGPVFAPSPHTASIPRSPT